jgi:hypothetical protein
MIKRVPGAILALLLAGQVVAQTSPGQSSVPPAGWPRHVQLADGALLVYAPQVVQWDGSAIALRTAIAMRKSVGNEVFGTLDATAVAHVDKIARSVALADVKVTRIALPGVADTSALSAAAPAALASVSLDRLQMSLAALDGKPATVAVGNPVPRVIVSTSPAILVPIDGAPVWKPVAGSPGFSRIVNTRALILRSDAAPQVFLRVYDGWLMADSLAGPWQQPLLAPTGMDAVGRKIAATRVVDVLDGGKRAKPKPSLARGIPAIYTSETPAELIVFKGTPELTPIVGTSLLWATNTTSDVFRDASGYYVLLAGRWFRAASLDGPWAYVAGGALPADFARIPPTSLAGAVLAAVPGTPQARNAVVEAQIPQTATVPRKGGPAFTAKYDGAPQFVDEPGTPLARAINASVPVIRAGNAYYAVKTGLWFTATQPTGPWAIATSVPPSIYAIPPTSPIYYVTFVRIYGATDKAVFEGYTPGYLGAYVAPGGTVVYGTGYDARPWIGNAWYPAPATYGLAAAPVFNPRVGYTYAFATGLATPSFSGTAQFHPGYWGHYPCCASTSADVYRAWFKPARHANRKANKNGAPAQGAIAMPAPAVAPPSFDAAAASAYANSGPQVPIRHMGPQRGYDMSMVTDSDAANAGRVAPAEAPTYISANEYYASLAKNGGWDASTAANDTYAGADGKVYRAQRDGWQQSTPAGWSAAPAPPDVVAQAQSRASVDPGMQAGSYGMSNATRFTGQPGDGWSRRDSGDGGYSRTLGGDGGISAEYNNYRDAVLNNEFDIAMNGGWWSDAVVVGWGGRLGD